MCRISAVVNLPASLVPFLHQLQANGSTRQSEQFVSEPFALVHSWFDVTTQAVPAGNFPYRAGRYAFHYNGEIFGCGSEVFEAEKFPSDVAFAADTLRRHGLDEWLAGLDYQGTIQVLDLEERRLHVAVDQLNTQGGFYAQWDTKVIVAQEAAVLELALQEAGAPADTPICLIRPGHRLEIDESGNVHERCYRPAARQVFVDSSERFGPEDFHRACDDFSQAFRESVRRRLPKGREPIGVLCGAGVDSAYLLKIVADILRQEKELDRLSVFTLGADLKVEPESNDWLNSKRLFEMLGLRESGAKLHQIPPECDVAVKTIYLSTVFCQGVSRLITPDPVLNTQIRHTVRMSVMLESITHKFPQIRVVLSGDGADELFAGYNSMWDRSLDAGIVRRNVLDKLQDLTLNDFARVSLAAFHGTCAAAKLLRIAPYLQQQADPRFARLAGRLHQSSQEELRALAAELELVDPVLDRMLASLHPIEVRLPYSSDRVLNALGDVNPAYLIGQFDRRLISKFLLRCAAHRDGLPTEFCRRKKMPMHEGGTGVKNADRFSVEVEAAAEGGGDVTLWREKLLGIMARLSLLSTKGNAVGDEQVLAVKKAMQSGLARMLDGRVFRENMPDCIYSTDEKDNIYRDWLVVYRSKVSGAVGVRKPDSAPDRTSMAA